MKTQLTLASMLIGGALLCAQQPPNHADKAGPAALDEKCSLNLAKGVRLELNARKIEWKGPPRKTPGVGFVEHEGAVYISEVAPPYKILVSGILHAGDKAIKLDVSGLANPWIEPEELTPAWANLEAVPAANFFKLSVVFAKGGAGDYMVEWIILGDTSLRTKIEPIEAPPDWVKKESGEKKGDEK